MDQSVEQTLDFFIKESLASQESLKEQQLKKKTPHEIVSVSYRKEKAAIKTKELASQIRELED